MDEKSVEDLLKEIRTNKKLTIKPKFISVEVPFTHFKNGRRGFTRDQIEDDVAAARFYSEFKEFFDPDLLTDNFYFRERPGDQA